MYRCRHCRKWTTHPTYKCLCFGCFMSEANTFGEAVTHNWIESPDAEKRNLEEYIEEHPGVYRVGDLLMTETTATQRAKELREKAVKLRDEANKLDNEALVVEAQSSNYPDREIATALHSKLCIDNHIDRCDWFYDRGDWSIYSRKKYLKSAQQILDSVHNTSQSTVLSVISNLPN